MGGGKGVICADPGPPPSGERRRDMLLDFADTVNALDGRYITAEDVGTSSDDMATLATATDARQRPRRASWAARGDPSPFTALGVEAAMRACVERRFGDADLTGRSVAIVGIGHVGGALARQLAARGRAADDGRHRPGAPRAGRRAGRRLARAEQPRFAPRSTCWRRARSAACSTRRRSRTCARRSSAAPRTTSWPTTGWPTTWPRTAILYAPDFVANAGGIINISVELEPTGYDPDEARRRVATIEQTMRDAARRGRARRASRR